MTEIEVPDWVVEAALTAYVNAWDESVTEREKCLTDWNDDQIDHAREGVKAALTAALGAWVVKKPVHWESSGTERVFIPEAPTAGQNMAPVNRLGRWETTYYWRALLGGVTKDAMPPSENLYALCKEPTG